MFMSIIFPSAGNQGGVHYFPEGGSGQEDINYPITFPVISGLPLLKLRTSTPLQNAASFVNYRRTGFDCRYQSVAVNGSAIWIVFGW